ncbi:unnamed protein product [Rhizophagus irregularis]|nr:unnamed protein product [Rhizophagus irregularis]
MLEKSLRRIKLPEKFINLVMEINLNRFNKVLVNNDTTEEYYVQDRIDQGEVWSPILWRIFYDALLARLDEIKDEVGYKLNEIKLIVDIDKREEEELTVTFNVTAFMDYMTQIKEQG